MAETSIVSAIAVPQAVDDQPPEPNSLKRRQHEEAEEEQESKRQRISPGKNSPAGPADDAQQIQGRLDGAAEDQPKVDTREARRKSSVADEKQRSKRLFGALLGSLNQPGDRTSKRRQEIESRRKAELQRQDDEHVEDKLRRQEKLAERREREQERIDEQNMHLRHENLLHTANLLQTTTEPKLYYRPWDLLPDEEDRIEAQLKDAQAQIDKELDEFERLRQRNGHNDRRTPTQTRSQTRTMSPDQDRKTQHPSSDLIKQPEAEIHEAEVEHTAPAKSEDSKTADVRDSEATNTDTNHSDLEPNIGEIPGSKQGVTEDAEEHEEGDHVVLGDEDTVIY